MGERGYGVGLLVLLLVTACGDEPGPAAVFEAWLGHLVRGEVEDAFELLSSDSRRALAEGEAAWIAGRDHRLAPKDEPVSGPDGQEGLRLFRRLVAGPGFHGVPPLPGDAADRVESATITGDGATVVVRTADGPQHARLVREDGSWRVAVLP